MGRAALVLALLLVAAPVRAAPLALDGQAPTTTEALLVRPDAQTIILPFVQGYGAGAWRFRAIPLAPLARSLGVTPAGTLTTRATDNFVAHIPGALVLEETAGRPRAWLAIEDPASPWPVLPRDTASPGPFFIVWQDPDTTITTEFWGWKLAGLGATAAPADRWPQLRVAAALPTGAPERRGQELLIGICLSCHRFAGAGEADMGPDLARPMNPVRYFQRAALARYIRDPSSVRHWPGQRMPGFPAAALPDQDIEAIIRYLEHMADR